MLANIWLVSLYAHWTYVTRGVLLLRAKPWFGDLAAAFEGDPLHCRSYIWYILVDLTSIKNTLHEVSRKLIWETMFIYIKCNVSIKFNNGSSIVSITVACYKNKWFGKMAERFKCLNILPLVSKYMQYCGIYIRYNIPFSF